MGNLALLALRVVLAAVLAGSLFVQVVMVPLLAADFEESGSDLADVRIPVVVILILGIMTMQVTTVCVWRLLTMVRRDTVFSHAAFGYVNVAIGAIATASLLTLALAATLAPADYRALPRVTFTDPEIGSVGLTEQQAVEQGLPVSTGIAQVPSTARGWIHKAGNTGIIKLVADTDRGVLVGATSAGPNGGEVLGALSVAIHGRVPVEDLRHMIYAYPTFHRGIEDALRDLA